MSCKRAAAFMAVVVIGMAAAAIGPAVVIACGGGHWAGGRIMGTVDIGVMAIGMPEDGVGVRRPARLSAQQQSARQPMARVYRQATGLVMDINMSRNG